MFRNEMKVEFASKPQNESFARVVVASFVAQLDPTIEELSDIKTAVSEAVTNAIVHGYEHKKGTVTVKVLINGNEIIIEVSDLGKGIEDIEKAKEPLYTSKPDEERSGMGFSVMEAFMEDIQVESQVGVGTKIIMKKKINDFYQSEI